MSSKQVNSPSFINALNISSWTFNVLTSTAKKMGRLKPPQPHPLRGPWTVNQACRRTLALKEALILQSSQIPLPNHVFYAFCNASNEGVNPRRKSWGSLRFFFTLSAPLVLSWQARLWLVPRGFFHIPMGIWKQELCKIWGYTECVTGHCWNGELGGNFEIPH